MSDAWAARNFETRAVSPTRGHRAAGRRLGGDRAGDDGGAAAASRGGLRLWRMESGCVCVCAGGGTVGGRYTAVIWRSRGKWLHGAASPRETQ
jgi:hypothetical protein